jgi:Ca-activated chloride channel family protein
VAVIGVVPKMESQKAKTKVSKVGFLLIVVACAAGGGAVWFANDTSMINLWLTPDQQGRYYFEKGDYVAAAKRFRDPLWKGIAYYRSKDFAAGIEQFARVDTWEGYFNLGNAYAHLGHLEQAVTNYEEVLRRKPDDIAARENRDLVQSLIQKKAKEKKEEETLQGQELIFSPDEVRLDEEGKKGKKGEIEQAELSAEQIQEVWMRRLQTTPADFLRLKFAAQVEEPKTSRSQ